MPKARGVSRLARGPAVGQLMQGDGRNDPKEPADNDAVLSALSQFVHPHQKDSTGAIAPRLFTMASVTDDPIVGIDLGTTHSLVAFCGERPRILGNDELVAVWSGWDGSGGWRIGSSQCRVVPSAPSIRPSVCWDAPFLKSKQKRVALAFPLSLATKVGGNQGLMGNLSRRRNCSEGPGCPSGAAESDLGVPVGRAVVTVPRG